MKNRARFMALLLTLLVLLSLTVFSVAAANTTDIAINNFSIPSSQWYYLLSAREKLDASPLYLYYRSGTYSSVRVKAYGKTTYSASGNNCTFYNGNIVSYVTCIRGTKYSVGSLVYENGYPWGTLGFWSQYAATINGEWSVDSANRYTVARP